MLGLQQLLPLLNQRQIQLVKSAGEVLEAFGSQLEEADQVWLSNNLATLPAFLRTEEGGEIVSLLIETYRKHTLRT